MMDSTQASTEEHIDIEYCEKHPDREARLRCNRCNRLMCTQCAVRTPTGYRCVDCVRGQQKVFDTAQSQDYIIAPLAAMVLSAIAGAILSSLWIFFIIIGAPFAGGLIAEVCRRLISRRRSRSLFRLVAGAVFLGGLLPAVLPIAFLFFTFFNAGAGLGESLAFSLGGFGFDILWRLLYAVLATGSTYYSLSGMRI